MTLVSNLVSNLAATSSAEGNCVALIDTDPQGSLGHRRDIRQASRVGFHPTFPPLGSARRFALFLAEMHNTSSVLWQIGGPNDPYVTPPIAFPS